MIKHSFHHILIWVIIMDEKSERPVEVDFPDFPEAIGEMRLFADEYISDSASANECTGLIQVAPADEDVQDAYDSVYSYRAKTEKNDRTL